MLFRCERCLHVMEGKHVLIGWNNRGMHRGRRSAALRLMQQIKPLMTLLSGRWKATTYTWHVALPPPLILLSVAMSNNSSLLICCPSPWTATLAASHAYNVPYQMHEHHFEAFKNFAEKHAAVPQAQLRPIASRPIPSFPCSVDEASCVVTLICKKGPEKCADVESAHYFYGYRAVGAR